MLIPIHPARLLKYPAADRPPNMLNDLIASDLTWGDLEVEWLRLASPANAQLVQDLVIFLWKESGHLPEQHTFHRILAATIILAGPAYDFGSEEGPAIET